MKTSKLGSLVTISIGRTPSRSDPSLWDKNKTTQNIWLSIADLLATDGRSVSKSKEHISDSAAKSFSYVPAGTLMVSFKLTLGRLAFAGADLRTNEAIAALKNDEQVVLNEYLYHYLSHFDWKKYAEADHKVKGLTLNKAKLGEIPIIYPESKDIQKSIVQSLDQAFEKVDQAMEVTMKKQQALRDLKKSLLYQHLVDTDSENE